MNVAGIVLTNADRVLYPDQGLTKHDLAAYYDAIAPLMLPHVADRPLALVRCPEGTGKACFFQKHWARQLPAAVDTVDIREESGAWKPYAVVHDAAGLVSLVQHGVLEFHLWGVRADNVEAPDRIVFDLDPGPGLSWTRVQEGARAIRTILEEVGLDSWIKTTGGKGLHVVVPIARRASWAEVSAFARGVARRMERTEPARYLARASKAARKGKMFVDWIRNTRGATWVAPWSTRARAGAPISVPLAWEELGRLTSGDQYHVADRSALLSRRREDPWRGVLTSRQRLTAAMTARLDA